MSPTTLSRPPLFAGLPVREFDAWEWRKNELTAFARVLGIPSTGTKAAIAMRVRKRLAVLEGTSTETPEDAAPAVAATSTIPPPQTPTVEVRTPAAPLEPSREFFAATPGVSRAQALADWYARRKSAAGR